MTILTSSMTDANPTCHNEYEHMCPRCYKVESRCSCKRDAEHKRNYVNAMRALLSAVSK